MQRILIAGIGNIFLGDDGFGVEVAQRLLQCPLPPDVRVIDFGIRGFDLAYALLDGYDVTIMIDATQHGGSPGTLYILEPAWDQVDGLAGDSIETHAMHPWKVLQLVKALTGHAGIAALPAGRLLVVGCEPATLGPDEGLMGLSVPVLTAVDEAVTLIESIVTKLLAAEPMTVA